MYKLEVQDLHKRYGDHEVLKGVSLAAKAGHALFSTKRHVNAVTDQMVGTGRSWSDADGLAVALRDPEGRASREAYLERMQARKKDRG
jgi:hypothetical protein